jgi:hypothetical protein
MKTVTNKTTKPIKVSLPRGKSLHLGPKKSGQIRNEDAEHAGVKKLVEAGQIEVVEGGHRESGATGGTTAPHEATHGLAGQGNLPQRRGER